MRLFAGLPDNVDDMTVEQRLQDVAVEIFCTIEGNMKSNLATMLKQNGLTWKADGKDLVLKGTTLEYKGSPIGDVL